MIYWAGLAVIGVVLSVFCYLVYKNIYKELQSIFDEIGPEIRPLLSYTSAVNYSKGSPLRRPQDWYVGLTVTENLDGQRSVEFTGTGAQEYFEGRDKVYARYIMPVLNNAKLSSLPKNIEGLVFYE